MIWGALKTAIRQRVFPSGESENLVADHDKAMIDAIVDVQTWCECFQFDNTTVIDQCGTLYQCGLTVFDQPSGAIKSLSVIDRINASTSLEDSMAAPDYCSEIFYRQVDFCYVRNYLHRSHRSGCCMSIPFFFGIPGALCEKALFPVPTDVGVPAGLPALPLGFHYPQTSTDKRLRSRAGVWAIDRGNVYLAPWIQSTEAVIVKWDGVKRQWFDSEPVDDDPTLAECIEEWLRWKHAGKWDRDEFEASRAELAYNRALAKLMRDCDERNRVRGCEPSRARATGVAGSSITGTSGVGSGQLFYNDQQQASASCPEGQSGQPVNVTIPAGTVASTKSVADANQIAQAQAKTQAQQQLVCLAAPQTYTNDEQTASASCVQETGAPAPDGTPTTATVPAGTVTSTVSKDDANAQAMALAQQQADAALACTFWNRAQTVTITCPPSGPDHTGTVAAHTYSSPISQFEADALAINAAKTNAEMQCGLFFVSNAVNAGASNLACRYYIVSQHSYGVCEIDVIVNVKAGRFTSVISQADANNQAQLYANSQAASKLVALCLTNANGVNCGTHQYSL